VRTSIDGSKQSANAQRYKREWRCRKSEIVGQASLPVDAACASVARATLADLRFDHDQDRVALDLIAGLDAKLLHPSRCGRLDRNLDFHRFDNHQLVAARDLRPDLH